MKKDHLRTFTFLLIFLFTLGLTGGFNTPVRRCHAISGPVDEKITSARIGFEAGIFGTVDKKDAQAVIDLYIKEFAKSLNIDLEAIIYPDSDSIVSDLLAERLDMVCSSVVDYYQIAKQVDTELAYTNTNSGRKMRKSMLLVRYDSGITGIDDLKGKRLLINASDLIGQMFINTILLRNHKRPADQYFATTITKSKPSKMVLDVFFKKSDACLIDNWALSAMSELNPQIQKQLKIVVSSPYIISSVTFFRKNFGERLKKDLKEIATSTARSTYGQQLLILFRSDNIAELRSSDLDSFKQLWDEYEERMQHWKDKHNAR